MKDTIHAAVEVKTLYRGTPKPDGWFGGYAETVKACPPFRKGQEIRIHGKLDAQEPSEGMLLELELSPQEEKWGYRILKSSPYTATKEALASFLKGKDFPGIGDAMVSRLWELYGENTADVAVKGPERLIKDGIPENKAKILCDGLRRHYLEIALLKLLPGLTKADAKSLAEIYREREETLPDPIGAIEQDPYMPLEDLEPSIQRFTVCDHLAGREGFPLNSRERLMHAIKTALKLRLDDSKGAFVDLSDITDIRPFDDTLYALVHRMAPACIPKDISTRTDRLQYETQIAASSMASPSPCLYDEKMDAYEKGCAEALAKLILSPPAADIPKSRIESLLREYEGRTGKHFSQEQADAVLTSLSSPVSAITGGPGRGKTEVAKAICWIWEKHARQQGWETQDMERPGFRGAVLTAPTGMAAKNMGKGMDPAAPLFPQTIMYRSVCGQSFRQALCIFDEASMMSLEWAFLALHMCPRCQAVFIGDPDQLPSIENGQFLQDILALEADGLNVSRLEQCYRTEGVQILENAERINQGHGTASLDTSDPCFKGFFTENGNPYGPPISDMAAADTAVKLYAERSREYGPGSVMLLSPLSKPKHACGTDALNFRLQKELNPGGRPIDRLYSGREQCRTQMRVGDRAVYTKNSRALQLVNGDCGTIMGTDPAHYDEQAGKRIPERVLFLTDAGVTAAIPPDDYPNLTLAYACTVHKSQGSEYRTSILAVPQGTAYTPEGFAVRNIIYTGVTRARNEAVLIGPPEAIDACIRNTVKPRPSRLPERVREAMADKEIQEQAQRGRSPL